MSYHTDLVELANGLLDKLPGNRRVERWQDIKSGLFVTLYEGLFAEPLPDAITPATSVEDDIHNIQAVIDTLSLDKLNTSMSHISGESVAKLEPESIRHLLEIFVWLYEYMLEKIGSEASSIISEEEDRVRDLTEDPDLVTPELIDDILEKELGKRSANSSRNSGVQERHSGRGTTGVHMSKTNGSSGLDNTEELIALGQISSIRDASLSQDHDGTSDLIALGDSRYGRTPPQKGPTARGKSPTRGVQSTKSVEGILNKSVGKPSPKDDLPFTLTNADSTSNSINYPEHPRLTSDKSSENSGQFDHIGARPRNLEAERLVSSAPLFERSNQDTHVSHHHLYHHYNATENPMARSLPSRFIESSTSETQTTPTLFNKDKIDSAASPIRTPPRPTTVTRQTSPLGYDRLHSLVEDTVSMSRAALESSPIQSRKQLSQASPRSRHTSSTANNKGILSPAKNGILSPSKNGMSSPGRHSKSARKVSFLTGRSSDELPNSTDTSTDFSEPAKLQASRQAVNRPGTSLSKQRPHSARPSSRKSPSKDLYGKPVSAVNGKSVLKQSNTTNVRDRRQKHKARIASTTEDDSYHSDSCIDYGFDSDDSTSFENRLHHYQRQLERRAKQVRFDDILDDSAPGQMGSIRRKLLKEDKKARYKTEFLKDCYEDEIEDYEAALQEELEKLQKAAKIKDKDYKRKVLKNPKTNKYKPQAKYSVPAGNSSSVLYGTSAGRSRQRSRNRKRSASASPSFGRARNAHVSATQEILPLLLEEFPYLHLSSETIHDMWRRSARQIEQLAKTEAEVKSKKSKTLKHIEDSELKHKVLVDMMKRELTHLQRKREVEERRKQQQAVKAAIRDKRLASARARRYYEEYQVRMRSRKLKKRTKEEQIFKKLFNEGLEIQKERIRDLRKYAKEQRDERAKKNADQVESIENYYRDQFQMLSELLEKEKNERRVRDKAQSQVVNTLQRDLRQRLEKEVRDIQEQIIRDDDDAYFRELDAQRMRTRLNLARYQAAV